MKARIASALLRALASTWRVHVDGTLPTAPCIVAFWHGEMLPVWHAFRDRGCAGLTSASRDGDMLAQLLSDWGYVVVRGSSSQGGAEALSAMVEHGRHRIVLVTPDGPRGPVHVAKPGAVVAAQRAGVPVIPMRATISNARRFTKSWDAFALPLPFTRITVHVGHPIHVAADADRTTIDETIQHLTRHLDTLGSVLC